MSGKPIDEAVVHAFVDWLAKEMPPGTYISSPQWWASRIIRQIEYLTAAQQQGQAVCPKCNEAMGEHLICDCDIAHADGEPSQPTEQGQAFDVERARTLIDYVIGYALAAELKSLSSDACVALRDLHAMLHTAPPPSVPVGLSPEEREAFETWKKERAALAQQPAAGAVDDTRRMDWLEQHAVEVRKPLRYGSAALFRAEQVSDDDEPHRTDLRAQIDDALATQHQEPKP